MQDPSVRRARRERQADAIVHLVGLSAALVGCALLVTTVPPGAGALSRLALGGYAVGLVAMLLCSLLYNTAAPGAWKARFQRMDHAAIFTMIAGTYTPVALLGIGGLAGWLLAGAVWLGSLGGAALKLAAPLRLARWDIAAYLLLGWLGVAALEPLLTRVGLTEVLLLLTGGLLYSAGVPVHLAAARMPYSAACWHGFVIAAAACHYAVVLRLAAGLG